MGKCILIVLLFIAALAAQGQKPFPGEAVVRNTIDSLRHLLPLQQTDTSIARVLHQLGRNYYKISKDTGLRYLEQAMARSIKAKDFKGQTETTRVTVDLLAHAGDHARALAFALQNLKLAEQSKDTMYLFWTTRAVWRTSTVMLEHLMTLEYARKAKTLVHSGYFKKPAELKLYSLTGYIHAMANAFTGLNKWDSAIHYGHLALTTSSSLRDTQMLTIALHNLGDIYRKKGDTRVAYRYYNASIPCAEKIGRLDGVANCQLGIARLFAEWRQIDSALYFGKIALQTFQAVKSPIHELLATTFLSDVYANEKMIDSAYKYQSLSIKLKDSLFNQDKVRQVQTIRFGETIRQQQLDQERKEAEQNYRNRLLLIGFSGAMILLGALIFFFYRIQQVRRETSMKAGFLKKIHQTELQALRAQMNPHFIFNCLNSINRYIVKSDHHTASGYLTKFARLIRLILDNSTTDSVTLDKEIQTLQLYIDMEKLRFDNVFESFVEVDEHIVPEAISIPSMLVQPYVENAIWHGLLHKETTGGKLWVRFRQLGPDTIAAEIEDNGVGRAKARELKSKAIVSGKSYGMQITEDRIFLINELFGANANVRVQDLVDEQGAASGTKVTIEIPQKKAQLPALFG